jgi:hypothetical protein
MDSKFNSDLSKEEALGRFLDKIYPTVLQGYQIERINNIENQYQGIDLILTKEGKNHYIDEKAQLDYLNNELPTFAFEISYLKNGIEKFGWLFDKTKLTQKYFLITGIYLNNPKNINEGFKDCNIISVDRIKLLNLLESKNLDFNSTTKINSRIRSSKEEKGIEIKELNKNTEGRFYYSKSNKSEQPINLVLYIDFLIKSNVAKKIY